MAYVYAIRACATPCARYRTLAAELDAAGTRPAEPRLRRWPRPATPAALLELHTFRRSTATLAGASLREVAEGLFGVDAVAADWHSRQRSACPRAPPGASRRALMRGGYRRLAQLPPPLQQGDVSHPPQIVPEQNASLS